MNACPHCAKNKWRFHCDKAQCRWLKCKRCGAIVDPKDWSHSCENYPDKSFGHGRTLFRGCSGVLA